MGKRVITICLTSGLNEQLEHTLLHFQIEITACSSLDEAWNVMLREKGCLIVLNATTLTAEQALECVSRMRLDTYAPILILAPSEAAERLVIAGADMCLQAYDPPERIISNTFSLLRRFTLYNHYDDMWPEDAVLHRAQLTIDNKRYCVTLAGEEITLQPREFRLL